MVQGFKQTSDVLSAITLFRDAKLTGSTWKEIFQVLSEDREQWVPDLEDAVLYTIRDISLVSVEFASVEAAVGANRSAFI